LDPSSYPTFADRRDAGRQLAQALLRFKIDNPVILAIPRGGVPVGVEVAHALQAPLDIIVVRKVGAPYQRELAIAAVVDGDRPETVYNPETIDMPRVSDAYMREESARQFAEIERRRKLYLGDRKRPQIAGRTAIVVDDGIATGTTVRAALIGVRRARPKRLVLATPVAPPDTIEDLRGEADEIVCLATPEMFLAISQFYRVFDQLTDAEVIDLLESAAQPLH
jgi:putative phosphoribosyl transferase